MVSILRAKKGSIDTFLRVDSGYIEWDLWAECIEQ